MSASRQWYVLSNEKGDIAIVDTAFRLVQRIVGYEVNIFDVSPDGSYIAGGGSQDYMRIWDIDTGHELHRYSRVSVLNPSFSPLGQFILNWSQRSLRVNRAMVPTGVGVEQGQGVRVYPVPGQETLQVAGLAAGTPTRVEIADALGRSRLLFEGVAPAAELSLPVALLAPGAYLVRVHSGGRTVTVTYLKAEP